MSVLWIGRPFKSSSEGGKGEQTAADAVLGGEREIDHIGKRAGQPEEAARLTATRRRAGKLV